MTPFVKVDSKNVHYKKLKSAKCVAIKTFENVAIAQVNNETYLVVREKPGTPVIVFKQLNWKNCVVKVRKCKDDDSFFFDICREIEKSI